ncbi:MAG: transketolase family protein [Candidatus Omnitrophica bacterium]|nr:transketolase family protein [Candidatus Omnitrophota bacterium]MBU0881578.1 transketolase family protein [Candidatus Omnitrophota bacterium]MBU0894977.1 transketolase family protein [Candidatus Omnitrophota bacterium]MBU1038110.1 transketolase family protein [Candidatus Omnitrophota bacterium]MBU1808224.1 transketolase family protein [Candidatus Omnitrophota bacterium]
MKMVPTRDGFGEGLLILGKENKNVVVLSADLTESTRAAWFQKDYPGRFFGMGVAEQDMFGTAAGLALIGKIPFACTFGVFASGRAWDQIRVSIAYMNLSVKIAGTHAGISVGPDGATHQALEEIALMRILPNMTVVVPCDALEARRATVEAAKIKGPVYLRFGRAPVPMITKEEDSFSIGRANVLREGNDITIFACGQMVYEAMLACDELKREGISARLINLHTPKPIDRDVIIRAARETGAMVTVEEHTVLGGMGSAIAEVVAQAYPVPIKMVGVKDKFGVSGDPEQLFEHFGLTPKNIVIAAREALQMKG